MKNKLKITYIGLDINSLLILSNNPDFDLIGINFIEDLLKKNTYNPINWIFKLIYILRISNQLYILEWLLSGIFQHLTIFSDGIFSKYSKYLLTISTKKIKIVDFSDNKKAMSFLKEQKADLIVINNWWLMPNEIINAPKLGSLNIHPPRLPQYRGSLPTLWSLKNNDKTSAVSFMIINETMDGGKIAHQIPFEINRNDNSISLESKIENIVHDNLIKVIMDYSSGKLELRSQDLKKMSKTAKYFEYMLIDWENEIGKDIFNKINLYPYLWPLDKCYSFFKGRKIQFNKADYIISENNNTNGTFELKGSIVIVNGNGCIIKFKLFKDLSLTDSIFLLINQKGIFQNQ